MIQVMKKILLFICVLAIFSSNAQVGINNTNPKANLDISASNPSAPIATDGLLIPRVTAFPSPVTIDQNGMLVFLTTAIGINQVGLYYYDFPSTTWKWIASGSNPYVWSNNIANTRIEVPKLSDGITPRPSGNEVVITDSGNFGIGTNNPSKSLVLNQKGTSDGFQFTGQSIAGPGTGTGFLSTMGYNIVNNKQMWFGDSDYLNLTTGGFIRYGVYFGIPRIDAVRGDGSIRNRLFLGVAGDTNSGLNLSNTFVDGGLGVGATAGAAALNGTLPTSSLSVDGNVGIGTVSTSAFYNSSSPFTQKTLINSGSNPEALMLATSSSNGPNLNFAAPNSAGNNVRIASFVGRPSSTTAGSEAGDLVFYTKLAANSNVTEKMRILDNGNVGIGTSTPINPLHISGPSASILLERYGIGAHFVFRTANGTQAIPTALNANEIAGRFSGWGYNGTTYNPVSFIDMMTEENQTATAAGGFLKFMTTNAGGLSSSEKMRISSVGNIGINTIAPTEKLDVSGNIKLTGALMPNNLAGTTGDILTSAGTGIAPTWSSKTSLLANEWHLTGNTGTTAGTNFLGTLDTKDLVFKTNSLETMRILANGSIGINTAFPDAKLHVFNSNLQVGQFNNTVGNRLIIDQSGNIEHTYGLNDGSAGTNFGRFLIANNTSYEFDSGNDSGGVVLRNNNGAWSALSGGPDFRFLTGGTSTLQDHNDFSASLAMIVKSGGNVGIGTASPTAKLDIVGTEHMTSVDGSSSYSENFVLRRTLTQTIGSYTEIGTFSTLNGGGNNRNLNIEISIIDSQSGGGAASKYIITANYDDVAGQGWKEVMPISTSGPRGGNYVIDIGGSVITGSANFAILRLRTTSTLASTSIPITLEIKAVNNPFAPLLGTGSDLTILPLCRQTQLTQNQGLVGVGLANPTEKLDVSGNIKLTGALMPNNLAGTSGDILTSAGAGIAPTWSSKTSLLANEWHITGNASTVDGTNFIGTTDNIPLNFRVWNSKSGRISATGETFFGFEAGKNNPNTGNSTNNTAFGYRAFYSNSSTSARDNTAIGQSSQQNSSGSYNTSLGSGSLTTTSSASYNTAIGKDALTANTASYNTALGWESMIGNTTGTRNIGIGSRALRFNSTFSDNIAIGYETLANNAAANNTAIGNYALTANTGGTENIGIGNDALKANTNGGQNTALGFQALSANVGGTENTAIGRKTLNSNVSGSQNTAVGFNALLFNTASNNTAVGRDASFTNSSGTNNTSLGFNSIFTNSTGSGNTAFGASTIYNTTGSNNTVIGNQAGYNLTTGSNNIIIGANTDVQTNTASDQMNIGNQIYGLTMSTTALGKIGIGTLTPTEKIDIAGNVKFSGAIMPNNLPGTTGQVLVSAGAGLAPTWSTISTISNTWNTLGNAGTTAGTNFLGTTDAKDLVFKTTNAERFRILANGFIGIIDPAPITNLQIGLNHSNNGGSVQVNLNDTDSQSQGLKVSVKKTSGSNYAVNGTAYGTGASTNYGLYGYATGATLNNWGLYVDEGDGYVKGKVGIGAIAPTEKLEVTGNIKVSGAIMPNNLPGTSGQVLTSAGPGVAPTWSNNNSGSIQSIIKTSAAAVYNVLTTDYTVRIATNATGVKLPAAAGNTGKIFVLVALKGLGTIPFTTFGGSILDETIPTPTITTISSSDMYTVQSDGTNWYVINK
jgi:hypothetical protein